MPGVATGLAVTGLGGDVLYIEAGSTDGEPGLQLTGQLGDVMKESAQIALSYVRAHADRLGVDPAALDRRIHVHVPAGAVPGRPVGRCDDGDRTGVDGHRPQGSRGRRDDRRGHAQRPGAADRRRQAEAAGRPTCRAVNGFHPAAQRAGPDDVPAEVLEALEVKADDRRRRIVAQALEPLTEAVDSAA